MTTFDVKLDCYMVEIYKGELRDLLLSKKTAEKPKLEVKMNVDGQVLHICSVKLENNRLI